jgi:hypothetical protein
VKRLALLVAVALVGACAPGGGGTSPAGERSSELLFVSGSSGLSALNPVDYHVEFSTGATVAAPGWQSLFSTDTIGQSTTVSILDPVTGTTRSSVDAPGNLEIGVVSGSGETAALVRSGAHGPNPWTPTPRRQTTLYVARPASGAVETYELEGNFEPEAFGVGDYDLFLIEHVPALNPRAYRVRVLELDTGKVRDVDGLDKLAPDKMRGTGRMQAFDPAGNRLYTLYTQQPANYVHGGSPATTPRADEKVHAFVHVLSLDEDSAHCIDLPAGFGLRAPESNAIAVSDDALFAVDGATGNVAAIDPDTYRLRATRKVALGTLGAPAVAAAHGERLYVAQDSTVVVLAGDSLAVRDRWNISGDATAVGASARRVFVATADAMYVFDAATGRRLGSVPQAGIDAIDLVGGLRG